MPENQEINQNEKKKSDIPKDSVIS